MKETLNQKNMRILKEAGVTYEEMSTSSIALVFTVDTPIQVYTGVVDINNIPRPKHKLNIKPCAKCGSREYTMRYVWDDTTKTLGCSERVVITENNYLQVECNTCQYSWREEVLEGGEG